MKELFINLIAQENPLEKITSGFGPFAFMKPVQDAIMKNQNLAAIGSTTSTILGVVDILIFVAIGCTLIFFLIGIGRYFYKGFKSNDETVDMKQVENLRKKEIKKVFYSTAGLLVVFLVLPLIVTAVSGFISM